MWSKIVNNDIGLAINIYLEGGIVEVVNFNETTVEDLEGLTLYDIKRCAESKDCMFFTNSKTENA